MLGTKQASNFGAMMRAGKSGGDDGDDDDGNKLVRASESVRMQRMQQHT